MEKHLHDGDDPDTTDTPDNYCDGVVEPRLAAIRERPSDFTLAEHFCAGLDPFRVEANAAIREAARKTDKISYKQFDTIILRMRKKAEEEIETARKAKERAEKNAKNATQNAAMDANHEDAVIALLGSMPRTARDLVAAVVAKVDAQVRYDGSLRIGGDLAKPSTLVAQVKFYYETCRLKKIVEPTFIKGEVEEWVETMRRERVEIVSAKLFETPRDPCIQEHFVALCGEFFDTSVNSAEFAADMIREGLYQCKRKLIGLEVFNHLAPIIGGVQGSGKGYFYKGLFGPIEELMTVNHVVSELTSEKAALVWSYYVIFMTEMARAKQADSDVLKGRHSSRLISYRPMTTNSYVQTPNNATLFGDANRDLDQITYDPTGNRRMIGLRCKLKGKKHKGYPEANHKVWDMVRELDWLSLWQSVDPQGEAPQTRWNVQIATEQEGQRHKPAIERWLEQLIPENAGKPNANGLYELAQLHTKFVDWATLRDPPAKNMSDFYFAKELNRIIRDSDGQAGLTMETRNHAHHQTYSFK